MIPSPKPAIVSLGNKTQVYCPLMGVVSMVCRQANCKDPHLEIDAYHETPEGERVYTTVIVPIGELITITELYELTVIKGMGVKVNLSDLRKPAD